MHLKHARLPVPPRPRNRPSNLNPTRACRHSISAICACSKPAPINYFFGGACCVCCCEPAGGGMFRGTVLVSPVFGLESVTDGCPGFTGPSPGVTFMGAPEGAGAGAVGTTGGRVVVLVPVCLVDAGAAG